MKHLFAILPALAFVTACTTAPIAQPGTAQIQAVQANTYSYQCKSDDNKTAQVSAFYSDDAANVKLTVPSLSLNQVAMVLKSAVSGSGERYVKETAHTVYDWHAKAGIGVLTITHGGQEYLFKCE